MSQIAVPQKMPPAEPASAPPQRADGTGVRTQIIAGFCVLALLLAAVSISFFRFQEGVSEGIQRLGQSQASYLALNNTMGRFTNYQVALLGKDGTQDKAEVSKRDFVKQLSDYRKYSVEGAKIVAMHVVAFTNHADLLLQAKQSGDVPAVEAATATMRAGLGELNHFVTSEYIREEGNYAVHLASVVRFQEIWGKYLQLLFAFTLLAVLAIAIQMLRRVVTPLAQVSAAVHALRTGQPLGTLPIGGELGHISEALRSLRGSIVRERALAYTDTLTGLGTRGYFDLRLSEQLQKNDGQKRYVMVVRLQQLSMVSSAHGQASVDRCIQVMSRRLYNAVGDLGLVSRYSEAGLACVLRFAPGASDAEALLRAEHIVASVGQPVPLETGRQARPVAQAGLAWISPDLNPANAIHAAESAISQARGTSTGAVLYSNAIAEAFKQELQLSQDLERAIKNQELRAYFEPLVDLQTCQVVAVEALVRWQHPSRGLIMPGGFIGMAERTGLIRGVDACLFDLACNQMMLWHAANIDLQLSFNLSPQDISQALLPRIEQQILRTGLPASVFIAELTESAVISDTEETLSVIEGLRGLGATICLDDFGTGYSSLSYLLKLPIAKLKIDRSFVSQIGLSETAERIIEATLRLASSLGIATVSEGVETVEQLRWLRARGCHLQQGWLFARAQPAEQFNEWLRQAPAQLQSYQQAA